MAGTDAPRLGDPYRVVLLAVGPGLVVGTVTTLLFGYGLDGPAVVRHLETYAFLLLWSLPGLPAMGPTLVRWIPRGSRGRPHGLLSCAAFLVLPLWHVAVVEVLGRIVWGESFLLRNGERILAAYLPFTMATATAWALYLRSRPA